jgi:hypothetical protein
METLYDRSDSIRKSVDDVKFSLELAMVLVVLVIFLFLRNISATMIPSLALPLSVIGHVRGDVAAGLHAGQSVADGADAGGGIRGGRRHRGAGKRRAPHGNGQDALEAALDGGAKSASPFFP